MCLGKEHAGEVWCEITGSIPDEVTLDKEEMESSLWMRVILLFG